jgi:hypothetical protein
VTVDVWTVGVTVGVFSPSARQRADARAMLHVMGQVLFLRLGPPYWRHRLDCDHDGDGTGSSEYEPPASGDS